jgi:hypothetical protein
VCKSFRKELTETMALVRALGNAMVDTEPPPRKRKKARVAERQAALTGEHQPAQTGEHQPPLAGEQHAAALLVPWEEAARRSAEWHVIDLCCGKSLTAALVANVFPHALVR